VPSLSNRKIEDARKVTLLDYMQANEPENIKSVGGRYIHKIHDSFVIDNGKGQWYWNSKGAGGHNFIDFLMKVENMDFVSAIKFLTEGNGISYDQANSQQNPLNTTITKQMESEQSRAPPKPKQLILPKANINNDRAVAYLMSRGISKSTIWHCINAGLIYESANKSCVFVGKEGNTPKYAYERSISGDSKKDVLGADKRYGFCLPPEKPESQGNFTLTLFESPIDLLAHHDIMKMAGKEWGGYKLSLGGVSSAALNNFLEQHPNVSHIYLCLDTDKAGQDATKRIIRELLVDKRTSGIKITISPPPIGKDFTDTLQGILKFQRDKQRQNLQERTNHQHL